MDPNESQGRSALPPKWCVECLVRPPHYGDLCGDCAQSVEGFIDLNS